MTMESVNFLASWAGVHPLLIIVVVTWTLLWKGLALWRAAGLRQKYWFIILLFVNTLGVLDIIYIFLVARKYKVEVVEER